MPSPESSGIVMTAIVGGVGVDSNHHCGISRSTRGATPLPPSCDRNST